jgi:hypothetical protein
MEATRSTPNDSPVAAASNDRDKSHEPTREKPRRNAESQIDTLFHAIRIRTGVKDATKKHAKDKLQKLIETFDRHSESYLQIVCEYNRHKDAVNLKQKIVDECCLQLSEFDLSTTDGRDRHAIESKTYLSLGNELEKQQLQLLRIEDRLSDAFLAFKMSMFEPVVQMMLNSNELAVEYRNNIFMLRQDLQLIEDILIAKKAENAQQLRKVKQESDRATTEIEKLLELNKRRQKQEDLDKDKIKQLHRQLNELRRQADSKVSDTTEKIKAETAKHASLLCDNQTLQRYIEDLQKVQKVEVTGRELERSTLKRSISDLRTTLEKEVTQRQDYQKAYEDVREDRYQIQTQYNDAWAEVELL